MTEQGHISLQDYFLFFIKRIGSICVNNENTYCLFILFLLDKLGDFLRQDKTCNN